MDSKKKERYKTYKNEDLEKAVDAVRKNGMSIRKASRTFKIPCSTLFEYKHNRNKVVGVIQTPHKLLSKTEEESLSNYLHWMAERMFPLIRSTLRALVQEILAKRKVKFDPAKTPSKKWCQKFLKRHKLSSKKAKQINRGKYEAASPENIDSFYKLLESTVTSLAISDAPECIFNMDETGFSKQTEIQAPVIVPTGHRPGFTHHIFTNDHITSVHAISASGQSIPPLIIFSKNVPRTLLNCEIRNWKYTSSKSGFISTNFSPVDSESDRFDAFTAVTHPDFKYWFDTIFKEGE